jgi:S1 RNA binding domain protein
MQPTVGDIFEGKVTGITKFGAFASLPDGKNGLIHISEIANNFVSDVNDHVSLGQTVKVKVIGISGDGKINLSIKQALPPPARVSPARSPAPKPAFQERQQPSAPPPRKQAAQASDDPSFEDKLKQFMHDSDSRISDSRIYADKKSGYRRRRD